MHEKRCVLNIVMTCNIPCPSYLYSPNASLQHSVPSTVKKPLKPVTLQLVTMRNISNSHPVCYFYSF